MFHSAFSFIAICMGWVLFGSYSVYGADAERLLQQSITTHSASDNVRFHAVIDTSWTANGRSDNGSVLLRVQRKGELLDIESLLERDDPSGNRPIYYSHQRDLYGKQYKLGFGYDVPAENPWSGNLSAGGAIAWQSGLPEERVRALSLIMSYGFWLDGYLGTGPDRLPEALIGVSPKIIDESRMNGMDVVQIKGDSPFGQLTVWVAPSRGHLAVKGRVAKTAKDLSLPGVTLGGLEGALAPAETAYRNSTAEFEITDVAQIDGTWIATAGNFTLQQGFSNGDQEQFEYHCVRSKIALGPDAITSTFEPDLPPGTKVNFVDAQDSGLVYTWDGSKPIVSVPAAPIANDRFRPGQVRWQLVFLIGGLLILGGTGVHLLLSNRRQS